MDYSIWMKCFFIGIIASSSVGPIFILTFNRSAIYGFLRGFATALGASIADGIYFFLAIIGVLAVLKESQKFMYFLNTVGGLFLILIGIYFLRKVINGFVHVRVGGRIGAFLTVIKSFLITIVNPLVFMFFIFIVIKILPAGVTSLTLRQVIFGTFMVCCGSLMVLSLVALAGSMIGSCISKKMLSVVSFLTGLVFISFGSYMLKNLFFSVVFWFK